MASKINFLYLFTFFKLLYTNHNFGIFTRLYFNVIILSWYIVTATNIYYNIVYLKFRNNSLFLSQEIVYWQKAHWPQPFHFTVVKLLKRRKKVLCSNYYILRFLSRWIFLLSQASVFAAFIFCLWTITLSRLASLYMLREVVTIATWKAFHV
jgi:hypothetical protein